MFRLVFPSLVAICLWAGYTSAQSPLYSPLFDPLRITRGVSHALPTRHHSSSQYSAYVSPGSGEVQLRRTAFYLNPATGGLQQYEESVNPQTGVTTRSRVLRDAANGTVRYSARSTNPGSGEIHERLLVPTGSPGVYSYRQRSYRQGSHEVREEASIVSSSGGVRYLDRGPPPPSRSGLPSQPNEDRHPPELGNESAGP